MNQTGPTWSYISVTINTLNLDKPTCSSDLRGVRRYPVLINTAKVDFSLKILSANNLQPSFQFSRTINNSHFTQQHNSFEILKKQKKGKKKEKNDFSQRT